MSKIVANVKLKGGPGSGHYGHAGRPGKVGGSASSGGGKGKGGGSLKGKLTAPSADAFLKDGNPGRGGKTKLPKGWRRTRVDEAKKTVTVGNKKVTVHVSFFNGYYASVYASVSSGPSAGLQLDPESETVVGGKKVEWENLQSFLDNIDISKTGSIREKRWGFIEDIG